MTFDFPPDGGTQPFFGLYPALVTDIVDPERLGRIQIRLPWLGAEGDDVRAWATLLTPYADDNQGFEMLPAVGTQVVVAFEAGNPRRPYIVGSPWNGQEAMPETPAAANNKRLIKTRSGSLLEFDDTDGAVKITISTPGGHSIVLDDGASNLEIKHSSGHVVTLDPSGQVKIQANSTVEVYASALNVHAGTATFDGAVNCVSLTASASVSSPSYTLGSGNSW